MGKIKKILENELVGGTQSTDVYPITSTKAVYDDKNRRLEDFVFDKNNITSELGNSENLVVSQKCVSQEIIQGGVYDVSAHNDSAVFESLQALLSSPSLSTFIPESVRHGGMSIRFIQGSVPNSDNKYVQYRLAAPTWSIDIHDWASEDPYFIDIIMQEVNEAIDKNTPIEIHGNVTNAPDEEDLTSVNVEGTDVLKFKDKEYNPLTYSGLGRKYLRKNIVNGVNILTQSMINQANTIYVIKYDYVLGEDITIPKNCVLEFTDGSIGGTNSIFGQNTFISAPLSYIFRGITVGTGFRTSGWCPEWFGAVGYDNLALPTYSTTHCFYDNELKSSVEALKTTFSSMLSSNTRTMLLHAFYVVDDEINVEYDKNYGEVKIIGCGDCGFLGYIIDDTKYLLNINSSLSYYNFLSEIKNFSVYLDNRCSMAGVLRFGRTIRSNFYNITIRGCFAKWQRGGITLAIPENDNIFSNIIMGCSVFDGGNANGHGLYYETYGYPAVMQTIISCRFQQLRGCGIVSEPGTVYGFSGSIIDCEIEGNGKGAIFIPTEIKNLLISGFGWEGAMVSPVDADYPLAPVVLGARKVGDKIIQQVSNLQFINSEIGNYRNSSIDYFLFMGNTDIYGNILENTPNETKCNCMNINVSVTDINDVSTCKYFTIISKPKNVSIDFSTQNVIYDNIVKGDCPVKFDMRSVLMNSSSAIIRNYEKTNSCTYTFIDNGLVQKGTKEEHAIAFDTSKITSDLHLIMDHYYKDDSVLINSMYIRRVLNKGFVQSADNTLFCIYGGGRLLTDLKGNITSNSDIITIDKTVYDSISVGDTIVGPWFDDGKAVVVKKNSEQEIQIDKPAIKTANNAPITGAIVLPVQMGSPATVKSLTVFKNTDYLPIGASVYVRDIGKPVWWNGTTWVDATGATV